MSEKNIWKKMILVTQWVAERIQGSVINNNYLILNNFVLLCD